MTYKELIEKLFGVKVKEDTHLCRVIEVNDCRGITCEECPYNTSWYEKDVDFGKLYANIMCDKELKLFFYKCQLNSLYGRAFVYSNGQGQTKTLEELQYADTDSFKEFMNPPQDEWTEVPSKILNSNLTYNIAEILDDATVHGLDFKYENGKYYYKERICP